MNNFNFRLKKLLDIRCDKEEESKREFKKAMDERNSVEGKLDQLKSTYFEEQQNNSIGTIVDRKIRERYLEMLDLRIEETCEELVLKEGILTKKREDLILKQREKKTVEIIKEKQYAEFIKEQNAIEQKNNDEFALYGFIRNLERR